MSWSRNSDAGCGRTEAQGIRNLEPHPWQREVPLPGPCSEQQEAISMLQVLSPLSAPNGRTSQRAADPAELGFVGSAPGSSA